MNINQRIKAVRQSVSLNQKDFASKIGITQAGVSWIEKDGNNVSEQNIKAICAFFHVSDEWLRTGSGDMFLEDASSLLEKLADGLGMSSDEQELLETFMSFPDDERAQVISFVKQFAARIVKKPTPTVDPIQQELADYEAELRAQQQDASASVTGAAPIKNRA